MKVGRRFARGTIPLAMIVGAPLIAGLAMSNSTQGEPGMAGKRGAYTPVARADVELARAGRSSSHTLTASEVKYLRKDSPRLPMTWCGANTVSDRPGTPEQLHFKVYYGLPKGSKSRLTKIASRIQADVVAISHQWAVETRGEKTIRWDMGSSCGPRYLDIQTVHLPYSARHYQSGRARNPAQDLNDVVAPAIGPKGASASCAYPSNRNALMYVDGGSFAGSFGGIGYGSSDASAENNENDCGGNIAVVFVGRGSLPQTPWLLPNTAAHELLHTMGAIVPGSPNATDNGHCTDTKDLLCYDDGSAQRMQVKCKRNPGVGPIASGFDCNNNDYFAPPGRARGSWLPYHWNLYDSAALAPCSEVPHACGGSPRTGNAVDTGTYDRASLDLVLHTG